MEKKNEEVIIEDKIISKIIDEKTQLAVRIPAFLIDKFRINPKKDGVHWIVIKTGNDISLHGYLEKDIFKNEKKD